MRLLALAAILVTCLFTPASAQSTGVLLSETCSYPNNAAKDLPCDVYFTGFWEGYIAGGGLTQNTWGICSPPETSAHQVRLITEKYMRDHPEQLHFMAAALIIHALAAVFPCKNSN